MHGPLNIKKV